MARGLEKGVTLGGRFRLEELVGTGGMGSVYAATDLERGHRVALKVLRRRYAERTDFRERFVAESRAAQRIPHPHILTVHDHGVDDGWHFIAMELAPSDLASLLELEGTLPVQRALNLCEQVAWALDVAHEHGVIHRDVKPENVLVRPRRSEDEPDHAYLADFGIAKLETAERGLTETGVFVGTVSYASPEQAAGRELDGRSDEYALACVLFECLTGRVPFTGAGADEVLRAHRSAPRPSASALRPALPAALDAVLARGLAVAPDERFPTCRELIAAARAAVRERPAAPRPEPTVTSPAARPSAPTDAAPAARAPEAPVPAPNDAAPQAHPTAPTDPAPKALRPVPPDGAPPPTPEPPADVARRPRRAPLLLAAAVGALVAVVLAIVLLSGGDDPEAAAGTPGRSGPVSSDAAAARRAVRQTVTAFGAARGGRAVCRTLADDQQSTCATQYETAVPAEYRLGRVDLGDDVATAAATHEPDGDRIEFELVREDGTWLLSEQPTFAWKNPDAVATATTVTRFGRRADDACALLADPIADQCQALLPPSPVRYDITSLSVSGRTARITTELASGDRDDYELTDDGARWIITAID